MRKETRSNNKAKRVLWMKARPEYEPLFSILDDLRLDTERHYWIEHREAEGNICDIQADIGQMSIGVEIVLQMSHNSLTIAEEYVQ